jgi:hypothetical protein
MGCTSNQSTTITEKSKTQPTQNLSKSTDSTKAENTEKTSVPTQKAKQMILEYSLKDSSGKVFKSDEIRKGSKLHWTVIGTLNGGPCMRMLQRMALLDKKHKKSDISFTFIQIMKWNEKVFRPLLSNSKVEYPVLIDPDTQLLKQYRIPRIPANIISNENGEFLFGTVGELPDKTMDEIITKFLLKT